MSTTALAKLGGPPVRRRPWPAWPEFDERTTAAVTDALASGRWTVTNPTPPCPTYERRFAESFAEMYGTRSCVPLSSGTAALRASLVALGVRPLDTVIVPALTWAAVGAAVVNVGAIPVPVDVERGSLCMSPTALADALRDAVVQPRAIVVVHQNCAVARVREILDVAASIPVVEDCSQAHGARLDGRMVGTVGRLGVFSLQQNKLLTCGEGGAVITDDEELARRVEQFRSVGRVTEVNDDGSVGLVEVGDVVGDSVVMSELHAAVALDQLGRFEAQMRRRDENVAAFEAALADLPWVEPVTASPPGSKKSVHKLALRLDRGQLHGITAREFAAALAPELGREVGVVDRSFADNPLMRPASIAARLPGAGTFGHAEWPGTPDCPIASPAHLECIHLRHDAFLGDADDVDDIVTALVKVHDNAAAVRAADRP